jgi:outer membrane protein assembly factor BamB
MRARLRKAALAALCTLAIVGCSSKGNTRKPTPLTDIAKPELKVDTAWSKDVGNGSGGVYSGLDIAVAEDGVYVAAANGLVEALQPDTGKRLWHTRTKAKVISGPTVNGRLVLVGTLDAQAIALKRADGSPLWRAAASSEVLAPPTASGDMVIARSGDGRVFGFDADSGALKWSFDRNEPSLSLRGLSTPLIEGSHAFVGLDNGHVVSLGLADGQLAWEQAISVPSGRTELDRLVDIDANLLMGPPGLFVVTYGSDLTLVDPATGQSLWRRTVKSYTGMVLGDGHLFVTDDDGLVWAFDAETGALLWKQEALKYRQLSPPGYFDGHVVVGDYKGYLHWLAPDDGRVIARSRLGSDPITAPPAASSKYLYVMDVSGRIKALEVHPAR